METLLQTITELIVNTPGNLIYHLVLAFSVISCLQAAWIGQQTGAFRHSGRLVFGLSMLLLGQAVLFFSSGLAWQGILDIHLFLPPLDRAVILFSLIWIVWLWNFPQPARLGDLVTGFLNLGVIIIFLITYSSWSTQNLTEFNYTWFDWTWELAALFVVLTGMALLIFSRPAGWGFGLGMLGLVTLGIVAHLGLPPIAGNFSGYIRLGQLAAYPMLAALLHRYAATFPAAAPARAPVPVVPAVPPVAPFPRSQERRRYSTDPRTLHAWLELNHTTEPEKIVMGMAKAISHTMLSDLCFVVNGPTYGHIVLQSGYDLIREEEIKGTMLEQGQLPMLSSSLQRGKPLRITSTDSQPPDLKTLGSALGLKEAGSMMFVPLTINEKPHGGLLFLSPYSNRQWNQDDQNYLASEIELIARLLQKAQEQGASRAGVEKISESLRGEVDTLRQENQQLLDEVNSLRQRGSSAARLPVDERLPIGETPEMDLSALVALQQEAQDQIAALQAENERLQSALREQGISVLSPDEFDRMEYELRATLQEIAQLQNQLAEANARNLMLERELRDANGEGYSEDREVINSLVQEIRQPMSSILGYTDLLLAESVGILGALQRKFLERVRASTERMRGLMDDLIQVATMNDNSLEVLSQVVNLGDIIDGAVADTSAQLREKNIALQVDLPQEMPQINADRDAIEQIILHLLQNAGAATPNEGIITLRARMQEDEGKEYLLLQISDDGGGIQPEDLSRVFARRYRADMPLIQGLGDTGVGLSIAKALVEAHGGRIWVDSLPGKSTTFSALLPVRPYTDNKKTE